MAVPLCIIVDVWEAGTKGTESNRLKFGSKDVWLPVQKAYFMTDAQLFGAACNWINAMFNGDIPGLF